MCSMPKGLAVLCQPTRRSPKSKSAYTLETGWNTLKINAGIQQPKAMGLLGCALSKHKRVQPGHTARMRNHDGCLHKAKPLLLPAARCVHAIGRYHGGGHRKKKLLPHRESPFISRASPSRRAQRSRDEKRARREAGLTRNEWAKDAAAQS